ncbi:MAG: Mur ligase family protein [Armatimonadota bacterium]|nr:Mur ligase family protein [Armatimonadota bacterium]
MRYEDALKYLDGLLEGARPALPLERRLDRMARLLEAMGLRRPPYPVVLVAGTKGKGSTATMLAAILSAAGRRVGLHTKPHVSDYRERIRLDGDPVEPETLARLVAEIAPTVEQASAGGSGRPTYFEVSLALALRCFVEAHVDVAVVEVGVGGRYDATNVLDPVLSVITPISRDHTETLGETLGAIARHKAGILRPHRPVVTAPQVPDVEAVLEEESTAVGARRIRAGEAAAWIRVAPDAAGEVFSLQTHRADYGRLVAGLRGRHQIVNAATAVLAAEEVAAPRAVPVAAVHAGLRSAFLPGRFEVLPGAPPLVLDVAHNAASMDAVRAALDDYFPGRPVVLVFGMIGTHEPDEASGIIASRSRLAVITEPAHIRPVAAGDLADLMRRRMAGVEIARDPLAAVDRALAVAGPDEVVCVTGSVYLVGAVRGRLIAQRAAAGPTAGQDRATETPARAGSG